MVTHLVKSKYLYVCIEAEGWYQEEGKKAQRLTAGDVVTIPANVKQ